MDYVASTLQGGRSESVVASGLSTSKTYSQIRN